MIYSLLLCSTHGRKREKKERRLHSFSSSFIHSFIHSIHLSPPPSTLHPPPTHPNMPTPPTHRLPHLLLPLLSITLNLAILGTSSRTLHIYQTSQTSNVYFLPIWNSHFDMRGLQTLVGTSVGIVVLNGIFAVVGGVCGNGGGRGMVCFFFFIFINLKVRYLHSSSYPQTPSSSPRAYRVQSSPSSL